MIKRVLSCNDRTINTFEKGHGISGDRSTWSAPRRLPMTAVLSPECLAHGHGPGQARALLRQRSGDQYNKPRLTDAEADVSLRLPP